MLAEDLNALTLLYVGDTENPMAINKHFTGRLDTNSTPGCEIFVNQEVQDWQMGHLTLLGLTQLVPGYPNAGGTLEYWKSHPHWDLTRAMRATREQNGTVFWSHMSSRTAARSVRKPRSCISASTSKACCTGWIRTRNSPTTKTAAPPAKPPRKPCISTKNCETAGTLESRGPVQTRVSLCRAVSSRSTWAATHGQDRNCVGTAIGDLIVTHDLRLALSFSREMNSASPSHCPAACFRTLRKCGSEAEASRSLSFFILWHAGRAEVNTGPDSADNAE